MDREGIIQKKIDPIVPLVSISVEGVVFLMPKVSGC